jgi:hypothetical protein
MIFLISQRYFKLNIVILTNDVIVFNLIIFDSFRKT